MEALICPFLPVYMPIRFNSAGLLSFFFPSTHRPGGQHGRVVVDVRDRDDGGGGVGEAKVQVPFHVRGLHDDGVLGDFLGKVAKHTAASLVVRSSAETAGKPLPEREKEKRAV